MIFENEFERLKYFYEKGWASKSQLQVYVRYSVITEEEYEMITEQILKS